MWRQVCAKMRCEKIVQTRQARKDKGRLTMQSAGLRLLQTYSKLAKSKRHLLDQLLGDQLPQQWQHYPLDDAIDALNGYQWFYHSHSPGDRSESLEHGHIHLFARRPLWSRRLQSRAEAEFEKICGAHKIQTHTRHLLSIGLSSKGIPISLFTVNSWVTGDLMLSSKLTMQLLTSIQLSTGHFNLDAVIESVIHLCLPDIQILMNERDTKLASYPGTNVLGNEKLELLSNLAIDLDEKLKFLL